MNKKMRKTLKKSTKSLRKGLDRSLGGDGIASGAITFGSVVAAIALDPELRARSRALASAGLTWLEQQLAAAQQQAGRAREPQATHEPHEEETHEDEAHDGMEHGDPAERHRHTH